jgi:hypothetical protein
MTNRAEHRPTEEEDTDAQGTPIITLEEVLVCSANIEESGQH